MATTDSSPDESVQNLERFIAMVRAAVEQVHTHGEALDEQADATSDLDEDAQEAATELAEALTDLEDGLERAEHEALEQVRSLRETAREGAEARMSKAQGEVESAQNDFDAVIEDGGARIEEAHGELDADGFDALARTVDAIEAAVAQDQQEAVTALDALDPALGEMQARVDAAYAEADAGMDETENESRSQEFVIAQDVHDGTDALETLGKGADEACRARAQQLEDAYEGWKEEMREDAGDLLLQTRQLLFDTAEAVETMTVAELAEPSEEVASAFVPHVGALEALLAYLEDVRQVTTGELPLLVDDLEKALGVMETVGALLAALE